MEISVDGKIVGSRWPDEDRAEREFEGLHDRTKPDAWLCGRVTMRYFAGAERKAPLRLLPGEKPKPAGTIHRAAPNATSFAVAVDASGKLLWKKNEVEGDHVVVLLTGGVPEAHLAFLRKRGVSYFVAGARQIDFPGALSGLRRFFGIKRLTVEGGGTINASLLHAGLIDELSLLLFPVADGCSATKSLFQTPQPSPVPQATALRLISVRRRPGGVLWLRYRVLKSQGPAVR